MLEMTLSSCVIYVEAMVSDGGMPGGCMGVVINICELDLATILITFIFFFKFSTHKILIILTFNYYFYF